MIFPFGVTLCDAVQLHMWLVISCELRCHCMGKVYRALLSVAQTKSTESGVLYSKLTMYLVLRTSCCVDMWVRERRVK